MIQHMTNPFTPTPAIPKPTAIPVVAPPANDVFDQMEKDPRCNPPADEDFTHGLWRNVDDGMPYALCVHEPDNYFRTHSLRNSAYFWQGTESEFRQKFSKL